MLAVDSDTRAQKEKRKIKKIFSRDIYLWASDNRMNKSQAEKLETFSEKKVITNENWRRAFSAVTSLAKGWVDDYRFNFPSFRRRTGSDRKNFLLNRNLIWLLVKMSDFCAAGCCCCRKKICKQKAPSCTAKGGRKIGKSRDWKQQERRRSQKYRQSF